MLKYFMFASILFIVCFLNAEAKDKISCYKGINNALVNMTKACDYCTYRQMYNSVNDTHLPNLTDRECYVGSNPTLPYFNSGKTFNEKNDCVGTKDNEGSYKYYICDFDFCNEKCENGAFSSLNFSIFGLILSILIPLKLA